MEEAKNPYEIKNRGGEVVYVATPELYRKIVTDTLLAGSYTHLFDIFTEPRLAVSFRTISQGEQIEMFAEIKKMHDENPDISMQEGRARGDMLTISKYMSTLYAGSTETPMRDLSQSDRIEILNRISQPAMEKLMYCYDLFMALVDAAFSMNELVKN